MKIGAHQSISGGLYKSIDRALADKCECLQIFVKNANRWVAKDLSDKDADKFKKELAIFGNKNICAHSSYLINLASNKEETYNKSMISLADELGRCDKLNIPYHVMHPGAHLGQGEDIAISRIAASIDRVYSEHNFRAMLLLETTAGQGTCVGHKLEHLEEIIDKSKLSDNIGICLDTCHLFVAGYDLKLKYEQIVNEIISRFGNKVKVCHINDSRKELGSRVDRHDLVGQGFIGEEFFINLINDNRLENVLGILETPIGKDTTYLDEIFVLKNLRLK